MKAFANTLIIFNIASYLFLAVFGLVAMDHIHHHQTMTNNCPFMMGEKAICSMSLTNHIELWKSLVTTLSFQIFVLVIMLLFVFFNLYYFNPPDLFLRKRSTTIYRESLITILFSKGILNPKSP